MKYLKFKIDIWIQSNPYQAMWKFQQHLSKPYRNFNFLKINSTITDFIQFSMWKCNSIIHISDIIFEQNILPLTLSFSYSEKNSRRYFEICSSWSMLLLAALGLLDDIQLTLTQICVFLYFICFIYLILDDNIRMVLSYRLTV